MMKKFISLLLVARIPEFSGDMSFETLSVGSIRVAWNTDSDYYSAFRLFVNKQLVGTTVEKGEGKLR